MLGGRLEDGWSGMILVGKTMPGYFYQSGGVVDFTDIHVGESPSQTATSGGSVYELTNGELYVESIGIGSERFRSSFIQHGGVIHADGLTISSGSDSLGSYIISDGSMVVGDFKIGKKGDGIFDIQSNTVDIEITNSLSFGLNPTFMAVPDTIIHMTGASFENTATDPDKMLGLNNLTLIFEGGTDIIDPFEIACFDFGDDDLTAFEGNFALHTLQIGGVDEGYLQLVDLFDNMLNGDNNEVLYVDTLILGGGSLFDLNGYTVYYRSFMDYGGEILWNNGQLIQVVPEPMTTLPLLFASLFIFKRKRTAGKVGNT